MIGGAAASARGDAVGGEPRRDKARVHAGAHAGAQPDERHGARKHPGHDDGADPWRHAPPPGRALPDDVRTPTADACVYLGGGISSPPV
eukprot:1194683-Prorocentrum_minimum.AAC.3